MNRILAVAAVAAAITGAAVASAAAVGSVCLTTNVAVNRTEAPTNGTNCVTLP